MLVLVLEECRHQADFLAGDFAAFVEYRLPPLDEFVLATLIQDCRFVRIGCLSEGSVACLGEGPSCGSLAAVARS